MEEKKNGWGGKRPNQTGRPRRTEEQDVINLLDKHIDRDLVVLKMLEKIKQGDTKIIMLYMNYVYGKPITNVNQTTTLTVNDVDISKLVSFDELKKGDK
jgi:hypothetical protein